MSLAQSYLAENTSFSSQTQRDNVTPIFRTPEQRFERAVRTLARQAKVTDEDRGSTPQQRTAARFALMQLLKDGFFKGRTDDHQYVHDAFEHAFKHDDVAPSLLKAIQDPANGCPSLDFSEKHSASRVSAQESKAKRAAAQAKREARRERDRQRALDKLGGTGRSKQDSGGKKGKKK